MYDKQFGFRKDHSTSHAVNYSVNKIIESIEDKKHVLGIFIDLSKAFDTIDHYKLLKKLDNYGIRGKCFNLLHNYLDNRQQYTIFDNEKSDLRDIQYGVPQGSVLGPLLFLIYINDIVKSSSNGHFVLFADDTNIFVVGQTKKDVYEKANKVINDVNLYMLSNQLHINMSKCVYIYFKPKPSINDRLSCSRAKPFSDYLTLSIQGVKLKQVYSAKFLGIIINENLTWMDHINQIENKLKLSIVMIKRIKQCIPESQYTNIYHTLFLSHLTYCISVWGGGSNHNLSKIFTLQKRCVRLLFGEKFSFDHPEFYETCARVRTYSQHISPKNYSREHTKPIFTKHELLTVHNLYNLHTIVETFKIIRLHCPISLYSLLKLNRQCTLLIPPKIRLEISRRNYIFSASKLWNSAMKHVFVKVNVSSSNCVIPGSLNNLVIPGLLSNSDIFTPIGYVKNKIKSLLIQIQKQGDSIEWNDYNFDIKTIDRPSWTWGID